MALLDHRRCRWWTGEGGLALPAWRSKCSKARSRRYALYIAAVCEEEVCEQWRSLFFLKKGQNKATIIIITTIIITPCSHVRPTSLTSYLTGSLRGRENVQSWPPSRLSPQLVPDLPSPRSESMVHGLSKPIRHGTVSKAEHALCETQRAVRVSLLQWPPAATTRVENTTC